MKSKPHMKGLNAFFQGLLKLIDTKSLITITLVVTLCTVILNAIPMNDNIFQLFNTVLTSVCTYYFARGQKEGK